MIDFGSMMDKWNYFFGILEKEVKVIPSILKRYLLRMNIDIDLFIDVIMCLGLRDLVPYFIVFERVKFDSALDLLDQHGDFCVKRMFGELELKFISDKLGSRRGNLYADAIIHGFKEYAAIIRFCSDPISASDLRAFRHRIIANIIDNFLGSGEILEVGYGTGRILIELAKRGYIAHGVDIDSRAADFVRRYSEKVGLKINARVGDISMLEGASFNGIVFSLVLHDNSPFEQFEMLEYSMGLLKDNGYIFVFDSDKLINTYVFERMLRDLGLRILDKRELGEYPLHNQSSNLVAYILQRK